MKLRTIDGYTIRSWFQFGHREVDLNKKHINAINVFPVNDGDTGTNLSATLRAMAEKPASTQSFGEMIERISVSGLAHARGNSGIIFASYVNGMAEESKPYEWVNLSEFAAVAHHAVAYVYKAIEHPVEGTMISVIRDWASFLHEKHHEFEFFEDMLEEAYRAAMESLAGTTEKLAVLKQYNVVDSGAEGFVRFLKGINSMGGQAAIPEQEAGPEEILETREDEHASQFRYCSEFLVRSDGENAVDLREKIENLGDCLISTAHLDRIRVHLHTNSPEEVMAVLCSQGEVLEQKVDDMHFQNLIRRHQRYRVALVTDSIADFSEEIRMRYQIHFIPLTILIDEIPYLDKQTITLSGLFASMKHSHTCPSSSQPEPARVREVLDGLYEQYDSVIIITVSGMLSGTYGVFKSEAQRQKDLGRVVTVIDSRLNSGAQGLLVLQAARMLESGYSHEETVNEIYRLIPKIKIYVCLDTIENAVRGGRLPLTIGRLGLALGARPIMTLDADGSGAAFGVGFSQAGITRKILALTRKLHTEKGIESYSIVHSDNPILAQRFESALTELTAKEPEYVTAISAVTAIHSGPGCVAICLIEK